MPNARWFVLLSLVARLSSSPANAQVITGTLFGTVKDASGGVLVGARISITSPALIGGLSVFTTNAKGQYRFVNLAPGLYELEVRLDEFADYREEGLRVEVGGTLERNVVLRLAGVSATVVVRGESPLLDPRKAGLSTNYGSEVVDAIPVRRNSAFDLMKAAPGVSPHSPSGTRKELSVFGSGVNENAFLLDGTNFTGPGAGEPVPFPDTDIVEELEVLSLGASAEYGNIQGGVFNVVTKQGGNTFRFDASYYAQTQGLTSQPVQLACECPEGESGYTRSRFRDFSTQLGGPILQDRVWFFSGYQHQRDWSSQPGADPRFPGKRNADRIFWKLTWQITPRLNFQHSYHDDFWLSAAAPTASLPFDTTSTSDGHNPTSTFAQLTHIVSDDTYWEARVSGYFGSFDNTPNSGSLSLPGRIDVVTGVRSDNAFYFGTEKKSRASVQGKLSHYAADFLRSDHDFKFGVQYVTGASEGFTGYPGGAAYIDYGAPFVAYLREPWSSGGESRNLGAFIEDVVRIEDRLTLSLGLRFDRNEAISADVPARDVVGEEKGETVEGLGTLYTWNVVSPRLGLNLKLTDDGRTVLRASYGRFYQGVFTTELNAVHPGLTPTTTASFDPSTGDYSNIVAVLDPRSQVGIDPETVSPHTDQFSIGLDREMGTNTAVGATYIKKKGRDFIDWVDVGGIYGEDTVTLEDGSTLPVFPLLNSPSDRFFVMTNPTGYFLDYEGLLLTFQKRWSDRWQALVSYTLSEAVGLQAKFAFEVPNSQTSSNLGFRRFAGDPNDLTNSVGHLRNDRTHMLGFQGSVEIPEIDVLVGANYRYLTGKPWAGNASVELPQGDRPVLAEPRGTRRLSSQSLLDLRVSKIVRFGSRGRLELLADILNLFNDTAEENVISENLFSPNFAVGSQFVDPRRAMIGVKFYF